MTDGSPLAAGGARDAARSSFSVRNSGSTESTPPEPLAPGISKQEMDVELESGLARPLSAFVTDFVCHKGSWWLLDVDAWVRIDDAELESTLYAYQRRLSRGLFDM